MRKCVFDLEANGLYDEVTVVHCGVFKDIQTNEVFKFRPSEVHKMLSFMDTCSVLIGQNVLSYDFPVLEKLYNYVYTGTKVDLLIMSRMLYPNLSIPEAAVVEARAAKERASGPHSVQAWGYRLGRGKVHHEDWSTFSEDMMHRCAEDVEIQHMMFDHFNKRCERLGWPRSAFNLSFKLFDVLGKSERHGWLVNQPLMRRYIGQLSRWIEIIDWVLSKNLPWTYDCLESKTDGEQNWVRKPFLKSGECAAIVTRYFPELQGKKSYEPDCFVAGPFTRVSFRRISLGSGQEVKEYLLDLGWEPEEWNYKKDPDTGRALIGPDGQLIRSSPKINYDEAFKGVNGKVGRLIARRITCIQRRSILQGLLDSVRPDGRIPQRITGIASTGRLTHGGIVNIPGVKSFFGKQMRKIFTVPEGYALVGVDASGCQNRAMAARVNDPSFTETLLNGDKKKGTHIHQINAKAILDVANEVVTYDESKTLNYAWMFGASDKKLGTTLNKPPEVGTRIREALLSVSPGLKSLVESLQKEWRRTATVTTGQWGRPEFKSGLVKGLDGRPILIDQEHTLLVYMLQSDEAILMQHALVFLYGWLIDKGWVWGVDFAFVANVHDEFQAEVRADRVTEYRELAEYSIRYASEFLGMTVPQQGESEAGRNWYETH